MRILLTNDDGITSPGLTTLYEFFSREHEVWVIAPDGERSGFSNAITFHVPIHFKEVGKRRYSCSGTPADCVNFGIKTVMPAPPDMIFSGINFGHNLGSDLVYSGTAAAARQGSISGIPSVALSAPSEKSFVDKYQKIHDFLDMYYKKLKDSWREGSFFNINFPNNIEAPFQIKSCQPGVRFYEESLTVEQRSSEEIVVKFNGGKDLSVRKNEEYDIDTIHNGYISLSVIHSYPQSIEGDCSGCKELID